MALDIWVKDEGPFLAKFSYIKRVFWSKLHLFLVRFLLCQNICRCVNEVFEHSGVAAGWSLRVCLAMSSGKVTEVWQDRSVVVCRGEQSKKTAGPWMWISDVMWLVVMWIEMTRFMWSDFLLKCSEVSYGEVLRDNSTLCIRVTLYWAYLTVLWLFHLVCILYTVVVLTCFVMCGVFW